MRRHFVKLCQATVAADGLARFARARTPVGSTLAARSAEFSVHAVLGLLPDDTAVGADLTRAAAVTEGSCPRVDRSAHEKRSCRIAPKCLAHARREMCCAIDPRIPD